MKAQLIERLLWLLSLLLITYGAVNWSQSNRKLRFAAQLGAVQPIEEVEQPVPVVEPPKKIMALHRLPARENKAAPPVPKVAVAKPLKSIRTKRVLVRAYTPYDPIDMETDGDGYTAVMKDTRVFPNQWGIAADPKLFPYGTLIQVPGYAPSKHWGPEKFWPVDDTGAICRRLTRKGIPTIEVRFINIQSAREWGERWLTVYIQDAPSRP